MPQIPWPFSGTDKNAPKGEYERLVLRIKEQWNTLPPEAAGGMAIALGVGATLISRRIYTRYGRRIRSAEWLTPRLFEKRRWIKGVVTNVRDGDNFRLFHTPTLGGYTWPFNFREIPTGKDLREDTLHIRIAGVDAPEASHWGKPAQPYSAETLQWLQDRILGKKVYCQLLRADQYSRVVCHVHLPPRILPGFLFLGKNLAEEMLKAGCAVTYEQAGAEYGESGKDGYMRLQLEAKRACRGMWKSGKVDETPAEYKRRHALAAASATPPGGEAAAVKGKTRKSLWKRLFFR
ncbi:unnamed protein product [Cyclocybe aegerita]|uniref:TNase-like domain-containing protein n=1 Tax=Cyclocybe aegerita TaxID=1973307 RepID=A0A8S0WHX3_CYCAE|nr:unnamed protein product [Cyclocybe aegerita]